MPDTGARNSYSGFFHVMFYYGCCAFEFLIIRKSTIGKKKGEMVTPHVVAHFMWCGEKNQVLVGSGKGGERFDILIVQMAVVPHVRSTGRGEGEGWGEEPSVIWNIVFQFHI